MALTQVKTAGIAADAVTGAKVADDQIDSEHYIAASIDNEHLADNAVGLAEMAHGTDGNLITYDTNGAPAHVTTGSSGQVLTSNGAGAAPTFQAAAAGGATINNATANELVTVASTTTQLDAEANLVFDGSKLGVNASNNDDYDTGAKTVLIASSGNTGVTIRSTDVNAFGAIAFGYGTSSNAEKRTGRILYSHADKEMVFYNNESEVMRFKDSDDVEVANGNVVIKTSGKGINCSATADAGGMSNDLLDDYEEGTWTPALTYGGNAVGLNTPVGTYVKVGNLICCRCRCHTTDNPAGNNVNISGLPYTSSNPANDGNAITGAVYMETCASGITTGHPMAFGFDNSTNFDIRMSGTTGGGTSQVSDAAGTGTSYMTTITYQTS